METQESPLRLDVKFEGDEIEASRFLLQGFRVILFYHPHHHHHHDLTIIISRFLLQGFQVIFFIIIPTILTILTVLTILNNTIIMPNILFTRS